MAVNAQPEDLFYEEEQTRIGPPSKSDLPPPRSGERARQLFIDDDVTRIGPPSKSGRPPPMSIADPQDAVDPDDDVTKVDMRTRSART